MGQSERLRRRLELRRSSAASRHRNHQKERKSGQSKWDAEDIADGFNDRLDDYVKYLELGDEEEE